MQGRGICNQHLTQNYFDSEEILDACGLCFHEHCQKQINEKQVLSQVLCLQCLKTNNVHEDHQKQILTLDSVFQELTRMILFPQKMAKDYLHRAAVALHKFQVIGELREKIEKVEEEVQAQILSFLDETEKLIHECTSIKTSISGLSEKLIYTKDYEELEEVVAKLYDNIAINPEFLSSAHQKLSEKIASLKQIDKKHKIPKLIHKSLPTFASQPQSSECSQSQKWQHSIRIINNCYEMFRDYAIKIVEVCTVESSDDDQDFHHNFAASARLYKKLQEQVKTKVIKDTQIKKMHSQTVKFKPSIGEQEKNREDSFKIQSEHTIKATPKKQNLNISLQTEFSYKSFEEEQKSREVKFEKHVIVRDHSGLTPGKGIIKLKNKFHDAKRSQFKESDESDKQNRKQKKEKKKKEKKLMFEKILGIYEKNYQETTVDISDSSQKKKKQHFVRH